MGQAVCIRNTKGLKKNPDAQVVTHSKECEWELGISIFFKSSGESTMQQNLKDDCNNVCKKWWYKKDDAQGNSDWDNKKWSDSKYTLKMYKP